MVKSFPTWKGQPTTEVFSWKDFSGAKYIHSMTECHSQGFLPGFFLKSSPFSPNLAGLGLSSEQDTAIPQSRWSKTCLAFWGRLRRLRSILPHGLILFPETYQSCPRGQAIKMLLQWLGAHNSMVFYLGAPAQLRWAPPRVGVAMNAQQHKPLDRGDISHLAPLGVGSAEQSLILAEPSGLMCCTHRTNPLLVYTWLMHTWYVGMSFPN